MDNGLVIYSQIKRLLFDYKLEFKSEKDYENFINDLAKILDV